MDIRTFAPARIQSARLTGKTFERSQRFSLEKRLQDSFGVHSGEVQRWVLSWGGDAKVLKPPQLAESVRQAAKAILNPAD